MTRSSTAEHFAPVSNRKKLRARERAECQQSETQGVVPCTVRHWLMLGATAFLHLLVKTITSLSHKSARDTAFHMLHFFATAMLCTSSLLPLLFMGSSAHMNTPCVSCHRDDPTTQTAFPRVAMISRMVLMMYSTSHILSTTDVSIFLTREKLNGIRAFAQRQSQQKKRHHEWSSPDASHWRADARRAWARRRSAHARRRAEGRKRAHPNLEAEGAGQVLVNLHKNLDQPGGVRSVSVHVHPSRLQCRFMAKAHAQDRDLTSCGRQEGSPVGRW